MERTRPQHSSSDTAYPPRADIASLYAKTCESFGGREPKDGELDGWLDVLSRQTIGEIDAAIRRWRNNTRIEEWTQRPVGARMPTAPEIKLEIERFTAASSDKFRPCWKDGCEGGWVRVFTGRTAAPSRLSDGSISAGGNLVDPKVGAVVRHSCFLAWADEQKRKQA